MNNTAIVKVQIIIRQLMLVVLAAFVDPAITTKFWITHADGPLEENKTVTWHWEMYSV